MNFRHGRIHSEGLPEGGRKSVQTPASSWPSASTRWDGECAEGVDDSLVGTSGLGAHLHPAVGVATAKGLDGLPMSLAIPLRVLKIIF